MQNGRSFAIIQRWQLDDNTNPDKSGRPRPQAMLVVTRLPPGPVCHLAYVDAAANSDANELARKAADELFCDFKCGQDSREGGREKRTRSRAGAEPLILHHRHLQHGVEQLLGTAALGQAIDDVAEAAVEQQHGETMHK
jgi:hypothetical protein